MQKRGEEESIDRVECVKTSVRVDLRQKDNSCHEQLCAGRRRGPKRRLHRGENVNSKVALLLTLEKRYKTKLGWETLAHGGEHGKRTQL